MKVRCVVDNKTGQSNKRKWYHKKEHMPQCHAHPYPKPKALPLCSDSIDTAPQEPEMDTDVVQPPSPAQRGKTESSSSITPRARSWSRPCHVSNDVPKRNSVPSPTLDVMLGSTKGPVRAQRAAADAGRESKARGDLICGPATSRRCPARSRRRCQGWSPWRTCRCRLSPWWRRRPKRPIRPRVQAAASSMSPPRAHTQQ